MRAERLLVAAGRKANLDYIGLDTARPARRPQGRSRPTSGCAAAASNALGDRRHHGQGRLHARVDVPGRRRGPRRTGRGRPVGRLPRGPARHLHLARGRVGGAERGGRPRSRASTSRSATGDLGARGWLAKEEGLIKLVADRKRGVLVGGCVVAEAGGEILSLLEVAVHAEIPVATLLTMHFAYPTYHRALEHALKDLDLKGSRLPGAQVAPGALLWRTPPRKRRPPMAADHARLTAIRDTTPDLAPRPRTRPRWPRAGMPRPAARASSCTAAKVSPSASPPRGAGAAP